MVVSGTEPVKLEHLKEIRLFQAFTDAELNSLVSIGSRMGFEAHSNIVIEGETGGGIYLILDGMVGVYKTNKLSGNSYAVGELRTGQFFGEMSLVDDNPRSATITALTDCLVFQLSKERFLAFLKQSPERANRFNENCVRDLVKRLRELGDSYVISQYQLWKSAVTKEVS